MALTDGDEPEKRVVTKDVAHVVAEAAIIRLLHVEGLIFFVALLAELNCGVGSCH